MTTTELIELLKKHERGGATGRPREVMFEVDDRIIDTDGIEVTGSGDGLISELYLSLPSAEPQSTMGQANDTAQSTNDCISRHEAIATVTRHFRVDNDLLEVIAYEIEHLPSAEPEEIALHESCTDCPLYDKDRHRCPRFNKVIPEVLREAQTEIDGSET